MASTKDVKDLGSSIKNLDFDKFHNATENFDFIGNHFGLTGSKSKPQVSIAGINTGPVPMLADTHKNPDGTYTNPATGQTYTMTADNGLAPIVNPNLTQQAGANTARAAGFYDQSKGYDDREQAAFDREGQLADHLNALANGSGPTVAGTQLAIGLDQASRQQLAQAAGASGNNAALGRLQAMNNTAALQAQTNQAASLARAQEAAGATSQLAGVTKNMTDQSGGMSGQKLGAGAALTATALDAEKNYEANKLDADKANAGYTQDQFKRRSDMASNIASMVGGG